MPKYGSKAFWDSYYKEAIRKSETEEWLCTKEELQIWLKGNIHSKQSILFTGCGLSDFPEKVYDQEECRDITCIDWCRALIEYKTEKNARGRAGIQYYQADLTGVVNFQHFGFDLIIDKGMYDCVACRPDAQDAVPMLLINVHMMLRPKAKFVLISSAPPDERLPELESTHAEAPKWIDTEVFHTAKTSVHDLAHGKFIDGQVVKKHWDRLANPADPATWPNIDGHVFMYILRKPPMKSWAEEMALFDDVEAISPLGSLGIESSAEATQQTSSQ